MPRAIPTEKWKVYFQSRDDGYSIAKACRRAGFSLDAAYAFERGEPSSSGRRAAIVLGRTHVAGEPVIHVEADGKAALDDFALFRLRYFGRTSLPWQERAAYQVLERLESPHREYVVLNAPPGGGKSTLFTHDIPAWLITRRRSLRVLLGSRTGRQATMYGERLRATFERTEPLTADSEQRRIGGAVDAVATLAADFGSFRPEGRGQSWTARQFTVVQADGAKSEHKEPTVATFGQEEGSLGGRYDVIIWDDLVDAPNTISPTGYRNLLYWWQANAERRLEPGGLLLLQGQRMAPQDLYRWALDVRTADDTPKYHHVRYRAHADEQCAGQHGRDARAWPDGCLLDPVRLPWRDLENARAQDRRLYDIQFQQEDGYAQGGMVEQGWLDGLYDRTRGLDDPPESDRPLWSLVTVDPSPSNWWAVQWWLVDPEAPFCWLLNPVRRKMSNLEFLTQDPETNAFSGLLHEMWLRSHEKGHPVTHVVVEVNAAQKWLLSQPYVQRWQMQTGVTFLPHVTSANKVDPNYGVQSIAEFFRSGRLSLPDGDPYARVAVKAMTDEVLQWPDGHTDDQVMALWFMVRALQFQYAPRRSARPAFDRPSWVRPAGRGLPGRLAHVR